MPEDLLSELTEPTPQERARAKKHLVGKVAELIESSGIDIDEVARLQRIGLTKWQGLTKDENGEAHIHDLERINVDLVPTWADGPAWPLVRPARPVNIKPVAGAPTASREMVKAMVMPDVQFGYRRFEDGTKDPFHDKAAIRCALKLMKFVRPDRCVNLGDFLDLPSHSRFVKEPSFAGTTNDAIDDGHDFLAEQRVYSQTVDLMEGNHDMRLPRSIMVNAAESFGLRRAKMPDSWPVLTVPFLLRLDDLGVEYHPGYPANQIWLNDNLRCIHGLKVKSAGSTAALVVDDERVSSIFGHIHRIELMHKTRQTRHGAKHNFAATPGCLCRIDGAVPSMKGGIDLLGRPLVSYENWQQGCAVVTYREGDGRFALELVPIHGGIAIYRDRVFDGNVA